MAEELITDSGRVFKRDINGYVERTKDGYKGRKMDAREFKRDVLDKNFEKASSLRDTARTHPKFSNLMFYK